MKTIVIQSAPEDWRHDWRWGWVQTCLESVESWAHDKGFEYRLTGDEIFDPVPQWIMEKTRDRVVVASDYARLLQTKALLQEGYERVIWCDADFLIFAPEGLGELPREQYAFGREVWIDSDDSGKLKAFRKIHNAFFVFCAGNAFLDFYLHSAENLLRRVESPMVPQFIGPKFLSAIHNMIGCPEVRAAGVLSPTLARSLLAGGDPSAVDLLLKHQEVSPAGMNISQSHVGTDEGHLSPDETAAVVSHLIESAGAAFLAG